MLLRFRSERGINICEETVNALKRGGAVSSFFACAKRKQRNNTEEVFL